jgi:hypothetical protein
MGKKSSPKGASKERTGSIAALLAKDAAVDPTLASLFTGNVRKP